MKKKSERLYRNIGVLIIGIMVVVGLGYVIMTAMQDQADESTYNATSWSTGTTSFGMLMVAMVAIALILVVSYVVGDISRYKKLGGIARFFVTSFIYFLYGGATLIAVVAPSYAIYLLGQSAVENPVVVKWVVVGVVCYFGVSGFGWVVKKYIWNRIKELRKMVVK